MNLVMQIRLLNSYQRNCVKDDLFLVRTAYAAQQEQSLSTQFRPYKAIVNILVLKRLPKEHKITIPKTGFEL